MIKPSEQEQTANQAFEQEMQDAPPSVPWCYPAIQATLTTLSSEQISMYLHEVRWLLKQLGTVMPNPDMPYPEVYQQSERLESQIDALQEALIVERVRRHFLSLQTIIWLDAAFGGLPDPPPEERKENEVLGA